jgi:hypothetical protein
VGSCVLEDKCDRPDERGRRENRRARERGRVAERRSEEQQDGAGEAGDRILREQGPCGADHTEDRERTEHGAEQREPEARLSDGQIRGDPGDHAVERRGGGVLEVRREDGFARGRGPGRATGRGRDEHHERAGKTDPVDDAFDHHSAPRAGCHDIR